MSRSPTQYPADEGLASAADDGEHVRYLQGMTTTENPLGLLSRAEQWMILKHPRRVTAGFQATAVLFAVFSGCMLYRAFTHAGENAPPENRPSIAANLQTTGSINQKAPVPTVSLEK